MEEHHDVLRTFAKLLRYPAQGASFTLGNIDALSAYIDVPSARTRLASFRERVAGLSDTELEELYTRTFDINPAVTLDIGFHLFGLAYKRGDFLVRMQQALREYNIDQGGELADHLPLLLELAATLPSLEGRTLIEEILVLPVSRMSEGLGPDDDGYGLVLGALNDWLGTHFEAVRCEVAHDMAKAFAYNGETHE